MPSDDELYRAAVEELAKAQSHDRCELSKLEEKPIGDARQNAVTFCLRRGIDLADGALVLGQASMPNPLMAVARALYECFLWADYASTSNERAREYLALADSVIQKAVKGRIRAGEEPVRDWDTNADRKDEFLGKQFPQPPRWAQMAECLGLTRVHGETYEFLSMFAHGSDAGLTVPLSRRQASLYALATALSSLTGLVLVGGSLIPKGSPVEPERLVRLFERPRA